MTEPYDRGGVIPAGMRYVDRDEIGGPFMSSDGEVFDLVGGAKTTPGDTELDDAIEIIVGDYIPDSLLRIQLAKRIQAEVMRRTGLGPYAHPIQGRCLWCHTTAALRWDTNRLYLPAHRNSDGEDCPGAHSDDYDDPRAQQ